jgi:hypothetical protein
LRITFNQEVHLGTTRRLQVIRTRDASVVDELDPTDTQPKNFYGIKQLNYEPFLIEGNTLHIQLRSKALKSPLSETYSIVISPGMFRSPSGEAIAGMKDGE